MKTKLIALLITLTTTSAYARCVVEILDASNEPLGYVYQGDSCTEPMTRCKKAQERQAIPGECVVTYDIGSKTGTPKP